MSLWSSGNRIKTIGIALIGGFIGMGLSASAQEQLRPESMMQIDLPDDSPLRLARAEWGDSTFTERGGLMQLDLRTSIVLTNAGSREIRGVVLRVLAHEVTAGGKGSVTVPSLSVQPGEQVAVRVDLRLLRPMPTAGTPLVRVRLDGVLFKDLGFFGDDEMNSRRSLVSYELQARRDRERFRAVLQQRGPGGLQEAMVSSLERVGEMTTRNARVSRLARAVSTFPEREIRMAAVKIPDAPVELVEGFARVAGGEMRSPQIAVTNVGVRAVQSFEIGLRLKDQSGQDYLTGLTPSAVRIGAGQTKSVQGAEFLGFVGEGGKALKIEQIDAFVKQVEFADGSVWIPGGRGPLSPEIYQILAPSPEELRLADLYRRKGLGAVQSELKKF